MRTPSDERVYDTLAATGIPGRRTSWHVDRPPLPRFTYRRVAGGEVFADDGNYARMGRYQADLYARDEDHELIERFEEAVESLGPFSEEEIAEGEGITHRYQFTVR